MMVPTPYTVVSKTEEVPGVITLDLAPAAGGDALSFLPGQFTMLYAFGVGEIPISISGDPGDRSRLVQTIRDVGAVSGALCRAEVGSMLGVRGPFGAPWPVAEAKGDDLVIVAGGLGLAPVRPIIYHVLRHRAEYGDVTLFYGARSPEDLLFQPEVERWVKTWDIKVYVSVDRASPSWPGHVGFVTRLIPKAVFDPPQTRAFVCGPEIMMRMITRDLLARGVAAEQVYLSMERNMKCAIGHCGHCQLGPFFVCKDGPVLSAARLGSFMEVAEL